ncbi:MAG: FAD-dependent oxidoreductase, partial [Chloroflexota bacterium]|nr:FAD-dependent oxidoreductase [Chloroflexota bacterium]
MADLSVEIAGVRFKNPVWTSSSEVTENFDKMKRAFDMGAGAVVAKSYTNSQEYKRNTNLTKARIFGHDRRPAYGRDIPRIYTNYWRGGIGLEGENEDYWFEELVKTLKYAKQCDAQVVGSVFGSTDAKEMARLAIKMQQIDIPMIELDLACPQGEELHDKGGIVKSCDTYVDITRTVVEAVKIPVFVKLSPQQQDLAATARAVKAVGAAGVTCHNRFLGFAVDIDNEKPYIWGWAGVGGTWMLPLTLRWVSKIHADDPKFPILGSNGAYDWEDVVRFLMSGASAIEFCSTVIVRGFYVVKEAIEGLNAFLDAKGHKSVREIIGAAVRNSYAYEQMWNLPGYFEKSSIDQDLCIHCGKCYDTCWYHGIVKKDEKAAAPCKEACPAHIDVPQYVRLIGQGKFADALAVVRESIPFPFVCGIACFHPCESKCLRGHLDDPIAIMGLKRFIAEKDSRAWQSEPNKYRTTGKKIDITGKKVAILGSGPAGLTAGYYLAEHGHAVTVFEAAPLAGGMMRVAIPEYRLPGSVLDREIEGIKSAGVEIKTNCRVSSLADLPGYDAVFVATGTHGKVKLGIEGEDSPGVLQCLPFLRNVKLGKKVKLGEKVAVIGGGNAAIDAARTASRLGARDVTVIYRRSRAEMPAS